MRKEDCSAVVMEVSSHALKQHRAAGIAFDGAIFTNLSPEHLDYHSDMEDYYASKRILFREQTARSRRWGKNTALVSHASDPHGARLVSDVPGTVPFAVDETVAIDAGGIRGVFSGLHIESPLIGRFNAENVAAAVAVTRALGIPDPAIAVGVKSLERVPGRLERVPDPEGGRIILVDYAHKPDALEKALKVLHPMRKLNTRILTVVGCGGDRDRTKRPVMGEIACRLSDKVFFTSDNPRTENPETILDEIVAGCDFFKNFIREPDRRKAIQTAIREAERGDLVLVAGKGHEDYQIVGTEKLRFDDREVAAESL
jgi:UDP-N-acetylmuramoyl-L-alanyl-D-glutamate--2,6-diaminopimelate ligase